MMRELERAPIMMREMGGIRLLVAYTIPQPVPGLSGAGHLAYETVLRA
jgi:hypothetical protein